MSTDRREQILARLVAIVKTVSGIENVYRNQGDISDSTRPASRIFDGGETISDRMLQPHQQPSRAGGIITMQPVVTIELGGKPEDIGPDLNALRLKMIKAVLSDAQLAGIAGNNGRINYTGCETNLAPGGIDMLLNFAIAYPLIVREL
jgi:hypothetical protein